MDEESFSVDDEFRTPEEQARYMRFIREEGTPLLNLYSSIEDAEVRAAVLNLVKVFAKAAAKGSFLMRAEGPA